MPDFGLDTDIINTQAHIAAQEKKLGHSWKPVQDDNGVWIVPEAHKNKSYSYNSLVQTDSQINSASDPACSSAGCNYASEKGKKTHEMNYFVPNFGLDQNVQTTLDNTNLAEQITGHKWQYVDPKDRPKANKVDYYVPNFGQDTEIKQTLDLEAKAEKKLNHKWNFVAKKDRPKPHELDYFVPSFGVDADIADTRDSETQAEAQVWSTRLGSQIGKEQAAAQIEKDAFVYRQDAEKLQNGLCNSQAPLRHFVGSSKLFEHQHS